MNNTSRTNPCNRSNKQIRVNNKLHLPVSMHLRIRPTLCFLFCPLLLRETPFYRAAFPARAKIPEMIKVGLSIGPSLGVPFPRLRVDSGRCHGGWRRPRTICYRGKYVSLRAETRTAGETAGGITFHGIRWLANGLALHSPRTGGVGGLTARH